MALLSPLNHLSLSQPSLAQIAEVPVAVARCQRLQRLNLKHNQLSRWPEALDHLPQVPRASRRVCVRVCVCERERETLCVCV